MDDQGGKTLTTHTLLVVEESCMDQNGQPIPLGRPSPFFDGLQSSKSGKPGKRGKGKNENAKVGRRPEEETDEDDVSEDESDGDEGSGASLTRGRKDHTDEDKIGSSKYNDRDGAGVGGEAGVEGGSGAGSGGGAGIGGEADVEGVGAAGRGGGAGIGGEAGVEGGGGAGRGSGAGIGGEAGVEGGGGAGRGGGAGIGGVAGVEGGGGAGRGGGADVGGGTGVGGQTGVGGGSGVAGGLGVGGVADVEGATGIGRGGSKITLDFLQDGDEGAKQTGMTFGEYVENRTKADGQPCPKTELELSEFKTKCQFHPEYLDSCSSTSLVPPHGSHRMLCMGNVVTSFIAMENAAFDAVSTRSRHMLAIGQEQEALMDMTRREEGTKTNRSGALKQNPNKGSKKENSETELSVKNL